MHHLFSHPLFHSIHAPGWRLARYPIIILALGLVLFLPAARPVIAAGAITVSKTAIEDTDGNGCSLYEALQAIFTAQVTQLPVNYHQCSASPGPMVITFGGAAAGGTITLPSPPSPLQQLPMINQDVTITGPVTINGAGKTANPPDIHIFRIASGGTLTLLNVTLKDGYTSGGGAAILDNSGNGTINLVGVSLINNVAEGDGGAINTNGSLNIVGSNFSANKALGTTGIGSGGAIHMTGINELNVSLSNFSGNTADKSAGAIFFSGETANISDVNFAGNIAAAVQENQGGGAIFNDSDSTLQVVRTVFNGNLTPGGRGGAIYNTISATSVFTDSAFNGNIAGNPLQAYNSTHLGGAIYNQEKLTLTKVAMLNNAAGGDGGAIANDRRSDLTITNSSFTANAAPNGNGGGLYNANTLGAANPKAIIRNGTFFGNGAKDGGGGGIFNGPNNNWIVTLVNTIVAGSDTLLGGNCVGTITSNGHNLDSGDSCGFNQEGDKENADAKLDLPAFNGGAIPLLLTQKLKPGSEAIDAGDPDVCEAEPVNNEDQRGVSRPKNGDGSGQAVCDIGAFEGDTLTAGYGSTPVQPGPISFGNATINTSINFDLSIFETGNHTLQVNNLALSGANAGDFSFPPGLSLSIADGDPPESVQLTCTPSAEGQRTATLSLQTNDPNNASVSYQLICNGTPTPVAGFGSVPIAPGPVDFGEVFSGTQASKNITVQNTGNAPLTVSNPVLAGVNPDDFSIESNATLNTNIPLKCQPKALGIRTAILTLETNDPLQPTVNFNLTCQSSLPPDPPLDPGGGAATGLSGVVSLAASPDGKHLYVTTIGDDKLHAFGRNSTTGALSPIISYNNVDMDAPQGVTVSPDGKHVYMTNDGSDSIMLFNRNSTNGLISFVSQVKDNTILIAPPFLVDGLDGARGVVVSPDGKNVYSTGLNDNAVAVFSRHPITGTLGFIQAQKNGSNGVTGLASPRDLAISPDGAHIYVASAPGLPGGGGTVTVFSRSALNGALTFVTSYADNSGGLDKLDGTFAITISPDGAHVYALSFWEQTVTAFQRNPGNGQLTLIDTYSNGSNDIEGLNGANGIVVSPDGQRLYAVSNIDDALVVFKRNPATGQLNFLTTYKHNVGGVTNMDGALKVTTSPDGKHIYATAFNSNAVALFNLANPIPTLANLSPASAAAGSSNFSFLVNGEDFIDGSQVKWNGSDRPTSFTNNTQVSVNNAPGDFNTPGSVDVFVFNPAPGGGSSNSAEFIITAPDENPVPSVDSLIPQGANAGDPAFTLDVKGTNFLPDSQVQWNGSDRPTVFISSTRLQAEISQADVAAPGPAGVTVVNPAPGGGASNAAIFDVAAPGQNPAPSITQLNPPFIIAAGAASKPLSLEIVGLNFIEGAQVQWNGADRPADFVSSSLIRVELTAADLANPGKASVTVINPPPGGGPSNTATFTIGKPGDNPVPLLKSFSINFNTSTLTLTGSGFVNQSQVKWNGANRTTTLGSSTQLTAKLSPTDTLKSAVVTVVNPGPGGGTSNDLVFTVRLTYLPTILK